MNKLKRLFGMPWLMLVFLTAMHSMYMLFSHHNKLAWAGAVLALWPVLFFFVKLMLAGKGRAPAKMKLQIITALIGSLLVFSQFQPLAFVYAAIVGLVGILLYDNWYSLLPDTSKNILQEGSDLPPFEVLDEQGEKVSSQSWLGQPLLLLFIRGNWCPLCVAQVAELANHYQQLAEKNVRLIVISAQPVDETKDLARKFSVPFEYFSDPGGETAYLLGIQHEQGTPLGIVRYSPDTVIPTTLICDASGIIKYVDIAENYRDRPKPDTFLKELGI